MEINECTERAFGPLAQQMVDSFLYAKLSPHLKRSINLTYLQNSTYDQKVAHLEDELEFSGLRTDRESPIPTIATTTTTVNKQTQPQSAEQQQILCRYCEKPRHVLKENWRSIGKDPEQQGEKQTTERPKKHT